MRAQSNAAIEYFIGNPGEVLVSDTQQAYVIEKNLGAGGFADVYRVRKKSGEVYALKLLRLWTILPEDRAEILHRFEREYTCSSIDSLYLVRSFDKGSCFGNPFFIMEYCPGGNLGDLINENLPESTYQDIATRILKGLHDLHKSGIIHRDLKPVNVLFNTEGDALLTDFGISGYLKSRITVRDWLGHVKKIFGTLIYMPPEQLHAGEAFLSLGPVTDMFAFGVTMHQVITGGELPFGDYTKSGEEEYIKRLTAGDCVVFEKYKDKIPALWEQIIEGCIQADPAKRIQQADEVLSLLNIHKRTGEPRVADNYTKGDYVLRVMQGEQHGYAFNLSELTRLKKSYVLTLGWFDEENPDSNDIGIKEEATSYISRYHATIELNPDEGQWSIRDGQWRIQNNQADWFLSTNGVLVNSKKVNAEGWLVHPGDIVTVGDTTFRLEMS